MNMPASRRSVPRAVIIGGSMSGLFSAAMLRQIGWHVDVFERSPIELVGRGAGITSHPELIAALDRSGAGTAELGVEVEKRILIDRDGRVIGERPLRQILTSWDRLQRLLRALLPNEHYHLGHGFVGYDERPSGVTAHFTNGQSVDADLLIGADGFRSSVRAIVAPEVQPVYAGYTIWRGAPPEAALSPATHAAIFPYFAFYLPPRQQVIGYPIAGLNNEMQPGRRRYNFIWYRVVDEETLQEMSTDAEGRYHEYSMPPAVIRNEVTASMRRDAREIMAPPFLDALNCIERPFFTPIYDFASPRMTFGRVALIGDAAANSRPHMGFGVSKAAEDACALADAVATHHGDIEAALSVFNALRQPIGERIMLHGRKIGTHLGVKLDTDEDRDMWRLLQDPHEVMRWIAVPNFLKTT
jgi:2-polyprenyl-6-methoxyphenol hydroxylase-like FAD-dependent oxidoreductase